MRPEEIISLNIKRIRTSRGMTSAAVAEAAGISRQAFSNIENNKTKEPRVSNLQAIAEVFNIQIVDLFSEPPQLSNVRFRSNSIKTQKDKSKKEQYLIEAAYWLKDFNFLQSVLDDKKAYKLKSVSALKIESSIPIEAAKLTRKSLCLKDNEPIGDITGLLESAGIKIKLCSFDLKNFFGFSISKFDGGPAIIVNSNKDITIERQIFTVAHELGHLILHPAAYNQKVTEESKREESEADIFASYFLMPQSVFEKKLKESYGLGFIDRVFHLKRFFGVSYLTVLYRLSDMGISDYSNLVMKFRAIFKNTRKTSLDSRKEPYPLEKPDFVEDYLKSLVRKSLDKDKITVSRAAEILNVPLMEMRDIINSWSEMAS